MKKYKLSLGVLLLFVIASVILFDETNRCQGCEVRRSLSSTFTYEDCPVCGKTCAVSRYSGKCEYCGEKVYPAVKKIYDDGTVILEDGSTW